MRAKLQTQSNRGNTIIEVVIVLPVFLLGILSVIWIGAISNAKSALLNAVDNGVRLGATRGTSKLYNRFVISGGIPIDKVGAIAELDGWKGGAGLGGRDNLLETRTATDTKPQILEIDKKVEDLFDGAAAPLWQQTANFNQLEKMPVEYAYAFTYIAQNLKLGVNANVRYPCDPNDTTPANKYGENCLLCRPANLSSLDDRPYENRPGFLNDPTIVLRRFAVRCDYRPTAFLLRPILNLLSIISGGTFNERNVGVVTYASYFGRDSHAYFQPGGTVTDINGNTINYPPKYCIDGHCY